LIQQHGLLVEWRPDHPIDDDEYNRDFVPSISDKTDSVFNESDYATITPKDDVPSNLDIVKNSTIATHDLPNPMPDLDQGATNTLINTDTLTTIPEEFNHSFESIIDTLTSVSDSFFVTYTDPHNDDSTYQDPHAHRLDDGVNYHTLDEGANFQPPYANAGAEDIIIDDMEYSAENDTATRYNLRNRTSPNNHRFNSAMDKPYNSKSYHPPMQMLYKDIFQYVITTNDTST
jgi:hypothetical protein